MPKAQTPSAKLCDAIEDLILSIEGLTVGECVGVLHTVAHRAISRAETALSESDEG